MCVADESRASCALMGGRKGRRQPAGWGRCPVVAELPLLCGCLLAQQPNEWPARSVTHMRTRQSRSSAVPGRDGYQYGDVEIIIRPVEAASWPRLKTPIGHRLLSLAPYTSIRHLHGSPPPNHPPPSFLLAFFLSLLLSLLPFFLLLSARLLFVVQFSLAPVPHSARKSIFTLITSTTHFACPVQTFRLFSVSLRALMTGPLLATLCSNRRICCRSIAAGSQFN
jgi:hypothetical protein